MCLGDVLIGRNQPRDGLAATQFADSHRLEGLLCSISGTGFQSVGPTRARGRTRAPGRGNKLAASAEGCWILRRV
jgi:hypothetical protein